MTATHIVTRYEFETICAGIFRLISDPSLFRKYQKYLVPEMFYLTDNSKHILALRKLINLLRILHTANKSELFSIPYVEQQINQHFMDDSATELKAYYVEWRNNEKIKERIQDVGCFDSFINYLQILRMAKTSQSFAEKFQQGNVAVASSIMAEALLEMGEIKQESAETYDFNDLYQILERQASLEFNHCFYLDCDPLDDQIGGFAPGTLNLFISVTNGGKTMMSHHLLKRCVETKTHVFMACVEDRPNSFFTKITSAVTGIPSSRLRKDFRKLTKLEVTQIQEAAKLLDQYVHVEFIYGSEIDSIHKTMLDYDRDCELKHKPKPIVNIIDYTQHIASKSAGDKGHEKIRNAYAARKDFCLKYSKIGFDFAQINRDGSKRMDEDKLLTFNDLAGAFDLAQVCDNIISINRDSIDLQQQTAKLFSCKARDGRKGTCIQVGTEFHLSRYNMNNWKWIDAPPEMIEEYKKRTSTKKDKP